MEIPARNIVSQVILHIMFMSNSMLLLYTCTYTDICMYNIHYTLDINIYKKSVI